MEKERDGTDPGTIFIHDEAWISFYVMRKLIVPYLREMVANGADARMVIAHLDFMLTELEKKSL